jgi:NAD(P)-dependent dehydrogenase (short-subunit alcohol dehydrogenase family)
MSVATSISLEGRVALVTGAATGLGNRIAQVLAAAGADGYGMDVVDDHDVMPSRWEMLAGDVTRERDIAGVIETVRDRRGRLDIVIANAGVVPPWSETEGIELDEWDRVFAVNVRGVIATLKHAVPLMRKHGGSIIAMGSLNSRQAHGLQCAYTASKHAVLGIVRSAALDLGRYGIRVNGLGPGPVATRALLGRVSQRSASGGPAAEDALAALAADTALGRLASEDDVARAALFLASDLSCGITGQILPVDAGLP